MVLPGNKRWRAVGLAIACSMAGVAYAQPVSRPRNPVDNRVAAVRADAPVTLDGAPDEPFWRSAGVLETFYEVYPGNHSTPPVRTQVRYAYDGRYLYIAAHMFDPQPSLIRRPFVRRDRVRAGQDYVQFFIDPFGARRFAQVFRVNVRGDQTDGVTNEATGNEDDTPDFPFDVATRVVADGWQAELRIPFSSLRFEAGSQAPWAIMAYRGWPRSQNTQIASGPLARDANCFLCFATTVTGIQTPRDARSLVATPYVAASAQREHDGRRTSRRRDLDGGVDVKWIPAAGWVIDGTLNPDFSELEADAPQITGNARFAASVDEKRPFFLEAADLLETPLPFIYTRSIADPDAGLRVTHRGDIVNATAWHARDRGGRVLVPGPYATATRTLAEPTGVTLARARLGIGKLAIAADLSDRRGGGYRNSVVGSDATWFAGDGDTVTVQALASRTHDREAIGVPGDGTALHAQWVHGSARLPWTVYETRISRGFRADNGYLPSADIDERYLQVGPRFFDVGFLNELQPFVEAMRQTVLSDGRSIDRYVAPGVFFQGPRNSYGTITLHADERVRPSADASERSTRFTRFDVAISPTARWTKLHVHGDAGRLMDFASGETAHGHVVSAETLVRPTDRIEIDALVSRLRMRSRDEARIDVRQEAEALTLVYHRSVADSLRLQWTRDRFRRAGRWRAGTTRSRWRWCTRTGPTGGAACSSASTSATGPRTTRACPTSTRSVSS